VFELDIEPGRHDSFPVVGRASKVGFKPLPLSGSEIFRSAENPLS